MYVRYWHTPFQQKGSPNLKRKIYLWLTVVYVLTMIITVSGIFNSVENRGLNHRFYVKYLFQAEQQKPQPIVLVGIDDKSLTDLGRWPWPRKIHRELLGELKKARASVVGLDIIFEEPDDVAGDAALAQAMSELPVVLPVTLDLQMYGGLLGRSIEVVQMHKPLPILQQVVQTGHINLITDEDGVIRKSYPRLGTVPSFSLAVAKAFKPEVLFPEKPFIINYQGPAMHYPVYSYTDVLKGRYPEDAFRGKIVLVGVLDSALGDQFVTPLAQSGLMAGVEIHANQIATLISGKYIYSVNNSQVWLLITVFALICGFITYVKKPIMQVGAFLLLGTVYYWMSQYLFIRNGVLLPYVPVALILGSNLLIGVLNAYFRSDEEKAQLYETFHRYLAPQVLNQVLERQLEVKLGGAEKLAAVLFIDIRGFTAYTRAHSPEDVVELLNRYLQIFAEVIFAFEGTLDKYLGDGLMAVFGAPVEGRDDLARAYASALEIRTRIVAEGLPLPIGMGLAYGPVISGNIGSEQRMDFTVIGDTVNTASRLEGLAGPGELIITEKVAQLLGIDGMIVLEETEIKGIAGKTVIGRMRD